MNEEIHNRILGQLLSSRMATVLLLLVLAVSSVSTQSYMDTGSSMGRESGSHSCAIGQMFCLMSLRCVDVVTRGCPPEPVCTDKQEVCNANNRLYCVDKGTCDYVEVKFKLQKTYDAAVGPGHSKEKNLKDHIRQKLADKLGREITDVWGMELHAAANSVWVVARAVHATYDSLKTALLIEQSQFLGVGTEGNALLIDYSETPVIHKEYGHDDDDMGGDDKGSDDWTGDRDMGGYSGEEGTTCPQGQVFCIMRGACVNPDGTPGVGTCPANSGSDDWGSGDGGTAHWGGGDWGMGGDDNHCHGDGCTICAPDEMFCMMRGRCVTREPVGTCDDSGSDHGGDGGGNGEWGGDWGTGGDENHCHGDECTICGPDEMFCMMRGRCVTREPVDTCDDSGSDHGGDDGGSGDWGGDWGMGGDENHCHGDECTICGPDEMFCMMRGRCVTREPVDTCDDSGSDHGGDDGGSGDWGGDWGMGGDENHCHGDECTICGPDEMFCMMRGRCVTREPVDICDDSGSDHGGDDGGSGDWGGDWGMGGDENHCHGDECTICGPDEMFCMMRGRCVTREPVDTCDDSGSDHGGDDGGSGDWGGDWGMGGDENHCHGDECTICGPDEMFCMMRGRCVTREPVDICDDSGSDHGGDDGGSGDWGGDWGMGGDENHCHGDECTICGPDEMFCMMRGRCVTREPVDICDDSGSDHGGDDGGSGDWGGDWGMGGDENHCHGDECTICGPDEMFCMMLGRCVTREPVDICDDSGSHHGGDDGGSGDWGGDWGMGGDENHCHGDECTICGPDEMFCMMRGRCVTREPVDICDDSGSDHGGDDGGSGDWGGDWGMGGDENHCHGDECTICGPDEMFCMMRGRCVTREPVDTCDDSGSDHGGDDGSSGDWGGDWGMGGDENHCHGDECTICEPGEMFCMMRRKCVKRPVDTCPPDEPGNSHSSRCSTNYHNVVLAVGGAGTPDSLICKMFPRRCDPTKTGDLCPNVTTGDCLRTSFECNMYKPCGERTICCPSICGTSCQRPEQRGEIEDHYDKGGTCPAIDPSMTVGVCGGQMCESDANCTADGKICCDYQTLCGVMMCVIPAEDTDDGGHSGWEGPDSGDDHWECREEGGCHQCEEGQVFCMMSRSCVDVNVLRTCPGPEDCPAGEVWCEDEQTCKTECETTEPPTVPDPDVFFLSIQPDSEFDYYLSDDPSATKESVIARLEHLAGHIRGQLEEQLGAQLVEFGVVLDWITAYPTLGGDDGKGVLIWARMSITEKDSVSLEGLEEMLSNLSLISLEGKTMSFLHEVLKVSEDPVYMFFRPTLLVHGEVIVVDIRELIPDYMRERLPQDLRDTFPTQASLSCEEEHKVFFIDPGTNDKVRSITVEGTTTAINVTHTDDGIKRVECAITFQELTNLGVNTSYQLGLILVPAELSELAQVESMTLLERGMQMNEDDDCQPFPDPLFDMTVSGDSLVNKLYDWPKRMLENGENGELWLAPNLPFDIQLLLTDYVVKRRFSLRKTRFAMVKISEDTRYDDNDRLVATLKDMSYNQPRELKADGGETNLLETRDNLVICSAPDFFGNFVIEITPIIWDGSLDPLTFSVEVLSKNDAPMAKENIDKLIKNQEIFVYPRVDVVVEPPEFLAAEIVMAFFSDVIDKNDNLGMGLLGFKEIRNPDRVDGTWKYAESEGSEWQPVPKYDPFGESTVKRSVEFEVPALFLPPTAMLKFVPIPDHEGWSWRLSVAPRIVFMAVDQADPVDLGSSPMVMLHYCDAGSKQLCGPGGDTIFSEDIINLPLYRRGCDDEIDSGSEMLNPLCPCDFVECLDCAGVDGGDAFIDACGNCNAPADAVTSIEECFPEEDEDEVECDPGQVPNKCDKCVPQGSDLSGKDLCDIPCGNNTCLDCLDVPNGDASINLCGECRNPDNFYDGCPVGIGKIYPEFQYVYPTSQISVLVTDSLMSTPVADILCNLVGTASVVPEVTSVEFASSTTVAGEADLTLTSNRLVLTLSIAAGDNAQDSAGQFDISCTFGEDSVSLSESANNALYTRFMHPTVVDITPSEALSGNVGEVTLTVNGLVDTGSVYCAIPCDDFSSSFYCQRPADGIAYYVVPAEIVDGATGIVTCNLVKLKRLGKGKIVDINVILDDPSRVNMIELTTGVTFTLKMPPPALVSAVLNWKGCSNITVEFNTYIAALDGPCSGIFTVTGSTLSSDVKCVVKGNTIEMVFGEVTLLTAGTELSLLENVVYDAYTDDPNVRAYSSGFVTVEAPAEMIQPDVSIFGTTEIGLQPEYLSAHIEKGGCLDFDLSWSVEAVSASPSTDVTNKVDELNSRLSSFDGKEKRRFSIEASEFISAEPLRFILFWTAVNNPTITGTVLHEVTRDDTKLIAVKIRGTTGKDVDPVKRLKFSSKIEMKVDQLSETDDDFVYEWKFSPSVRNVKLNKKWLYIGAKKMKANQKYELSIKVTYGALVAEDRIHFTTKSSPLIAKINGNSDPEMTVSIDEDVTLNTEGSVDPDDSTDTSYYIWNCETNENSDNPDDDETAFTPLKEVVDNGDVKSYKRYTETAQLLAADRNTGLTSLRHRCTLTWRVGERNATAVKIINYQRVIYKPKIIRRNRENSQEIITVGPSTRRVLVYRKCKAMTMHSWTSAEGYTPIRLSAIAKYSKQIEVNYDPTREKVRRCHIWLDFSKSAAAKYINGETYGLTLTAVSESDTATETIVIQTWVAPIPGLVEVSAVDRSILSYEAHKTKFEMVLYDWWDPRDDINLYCLYFYKETTSRIWENFNTNYEPMETRQFTLPEGTYEFQARCQNSAKLSTTVKSDSIITVDPVDMAEEELSSTVISMTLLNIQIQVESAVRTMINFIRYTATIESSASPTYVASCKTTITLEVSQVIINTIPEEDEDSDVDDAMDAVRTTTDLVKELDSPTTVSSDAKLSMIQAALSAATARTGKSVSTWRRKKREVIIYSTGMTIDEAITFLDLIGTLGTDADSLALYSTQYMQLLDQVMVGMCQGYDEDGTVLWDAITSQVGVRLRKEALNDTISMDVLHDNYTDPATFTFDGSDLGAVYGDFWACENATDCPCLTTAQIGIDIVTGTASQQTVAPPQLSDIIVTRLYDLETSDEALEVKDLSDPVLITITTQASDLTDFDLLCMMWVSEDWNEAPCITGVPVMNGLVYEVVCSCTQFGILGVFETAKSNDTYGAIPTTTTTATTTTAKPSKSLQSTTDHATCNFRLTAVYADEVAAHTPDGLRDHLKQGIAAQTGYAEDRFTNFQIADGSILITFDLYPSSTPGSDTLGQMLWSIENMVQSGTLALTNPDGVVLPVMTTSFTYTEKSSSTSDGDDSKSDATGAIVGGIIGALAIIGISVAAGIFIYKKYYTKGMRPNTTPSPPVSPAPSYNKSGAFPVYNTYNTHFSATPPPYRALETPTKDKLYPKVEKWTENELKPVEAPKSVINEVKVNGAQNVTEKEQKVGNVQKLTGVLEPPQEPLQRSKTTLTIGSASSLELHIRQPTPEERVPTPVDN